MQIKVNDSIINVSLEGLKLRLFFEKDFVDEDGKPVKLGVVVHTRDGQAALHHHTILKLTAPPVDDPAIVRYRLSENDSWWPGPAEAEMLTLVEGMQIEVTSTRN